MENTGLRKTGVVIQGFDVLDVVSFIGRQNKKFTATLLAQLEQEIDDSEQYRTIRKLVLDAFNNYTRSVVNTIFGDIDV